MHAPGNGFKKKGSACFFLFLFFLFSCSSGVCGYRRNETLLLAFDIASDMTKKSCNKKQLTNFYGNQNLKSHDMLTSFVLC